MHSCGHQSRQASRNPGRSCNWAWYSRRGDGPSYVFFPLIQLQFLTGETFCRLHCSRPSVQHFRRRRMLLCHLLHLARILYLPAVFIGLFSATYAILTIIAFYKNGTQFVRGHSVSDPSPITTSPVPTAIRAPAYVPPHRRRPTPPEHHSVIPTTSERRSVVPTVSEHGSVVPTASATL